MDKLNHHQSALIVVPPFYILTSPSLAAHLLQACARTAGFEVSVFYANLALAATIGQENYESIGVTHSNGLPGERLFAASAYGLPPLGYEPEQMLDVSALGAISNKDPRQVWLKELLPPILDLPALTRLEAIARTWVDETALAIAQQGFNVVGCTTTFQQTAASIALLKRVKHLAPQTITIIGGANCAGEMAQGMASLSSAIDYVFSGESEITFLEFLQGVTAGQLPTERIIYGQPQPDLDAIPTPDFTEYYEQLAQHLPALAARPNSLELPYESSRGCWWGQKHHCTFCGLNGESLQFRQKSPDRFIGELKQLSARHPSRLVYMADNIMPFDYFKTMLPRLKTESPGLHIMYSQKSNLSLAQVMALKQAGVDRIIPGIEALSTSLLKRMDKGVSARQNIALLRYGRAVRVRLLWLLLWGFPGDQLADYEETLTLMPLLRHLEPPVNINFIHFTRFSPYVEHPAKYGLRNLRPWGCYTKFLPPGVDPAKVAYYFTADYESDPRRHPDIIQKIRGELEAWRAAWNFKVPLFGYEVSSRPRLEVTRQADDQFTLRDTRGLPNLPTDATLTRAQAAAALVARRPFTHTTEIDWALEHKVGVQLDGWYIPLATAKPDLLQEFEQQWTS